MDNSFHTKCRSAWFRPFILTFALSSQSETGLSITGVFFSWVVLEDPVSLPIATFFPKYLAVLRVLLKKCDQLSSLLILQQIITKHCSNKHLFN